MEKELETAVRRLSNLPSGTQVEYANKINTHLNALDELREEIQKGLDSGEPITFDVATFKKEARQRIKSRQNAHR